MHSAHVHFSSCTMHNEMLALFAATVLQSDQAHNRKYHRADGESGSHDPNLHFCLTLWSLTQKIQFFIAPVQKCKIFSCFFWNGCIITDTLCYLIIININLSTKLHNKNPICTWTLLASLSWKARSLRFSIMIL